MYLFECLLTIFSKDSFNRIGNNIVEANLMGQKGTYLLQIGPLRSTQVNSSRLYLSGLKYLVAFKYFSTSLPC